MVYLTGDGAVKVNLLEAVLEGANVSVAQILYQAVYYTFAENSQQFEALRKQLPPAIEKILPMLLEEQPDYMGIRRILEDKEAPVTTECSYCRQRKVSSVGKVCEEHQFCSQDCLTAARDSSGVQSPQCPLCPIPSSKPRRVVMVKKRPSKPEEMSQKCLKCMKDFVWNSSDSWRLDRLGSSEYDKLKLYCSEECFLQEKQPIMEEMKGSEGVLCASCGGNVPAEGVILHCRMHGLCSSSCRSAYYRTENMAVHQSFDGALLCYQCLEQYLTEIGPSETPEVRILQQKLAYFKQPQGYIRGQGCPHCTNCAYIDCGYYLTPAIITYHTYQTFCIFCDIPIRINKRLEAEFVLSEDMPFLLRCEFRLHGVCSRICLRRAVSSSDDSTAIRCPRCPVSVISAETVTMALNTANPTIECIRRTPMLHHCGDGVSIFVLNGCCHEMCGGSIDAHVGEDDLVHCSICGNTATFDEAIAAQYQHTVKYLRDS